MGVCNYCSLGVFRWVGTQDVKHSNGILSVNIFLCDNKNCRSVFIADKNSINPNRRKQIDGVTDRVKRQVKHEPLVEKNTYDEDILAFNSSYVSSNSLLMTRSICFSASFKITNRRTKNVRSRVTISAKVSAHAVDLARRSSNESCFLMLSRTIPW